MLPNSYPRAVCFDLYGTLVDISIDTSAYSAWEGLASELMQAGVFTEPAELRARYEQLVASERKEHGQPFVLNNLFFFKLLTGQGRRLDAHRVHHFGRRFRALTTRHLSIRPYIAELLRKLRDAGCKLAIVSNTEATVTSHDLDELRLREYFDDVVLSSSVGVKKPEPRIFHIALRKLGVEPHDSVFVGDDYECDYHGALRAGLRPVLLCENCKHPEAPCVRPTLEAIIDAITAAPTSSGCVA